MTRAHRQGDSDEIEVFEATRYFSGGIGTCEGLGLQRSTREERGSRRAGRRSLDTLRAILPHRSRKADDQCKEKKNKQPSSPGGKLASFLNSFFKQTISRKRSQFKDRRFEEMLHTGRRRSSVSCSQTVRSNELDYSNSKPSGHQMKPAHFSSQKEAWYERAKSMNGYPANKWMINGAANGQDKEELSMPTEEDGGGSESSSDLFELNSFDLGSDLPVYGSPDSDTYSRQSCFHR
ncbi:hypothetical protein B296_00043924 [Ensete ventricosum]|uniref:Protein BIG GRAIN 1-like E n=1 Tax=Ensete ventricosum TaxID=4639 RepID=A0A426ZCN9_ENSVE|nr:hypothetical protein B296_00043924 [Ensete ventricosum]